MVDSSLPPPAVDSKKSPVPNIYEERLAEFERNALRVNDEFLTEVQSSPTPAVIFHYTNYAAFHSILESGVLQVGDAFAMNDPSELVHGMASAVSALKDRISASTSEIDRKFLQHYGAFVEHGLRTAANFHVCSFSALGDSLSQWRAYADNGAGYALGFDGAALADAFTQVDGQRNQHRSVFHMSYDDGKLDKLQRETVAFAHELVRLPLELKDAHHGGRFLIDLSTKASLHALLNAMFFKHEAYRDEAEFRFLAVDAAGPGERRKHRLRPHELVRFIDFPWRTLAKNALKEVVLGPAAPHSAQRFAEDCLGEYGYEGVRVWRSKVPYRIPYR